MKSCATQDWGRAQGDGKPGNLARLDTRADRAAMSGASDGTQKMADKVAKASPELAKQVGRGEISLPKAVEQITGKRPGEARRPHRRPDCIIGCLCKSVRISMIYTQRPARLRPV